MNGVLAEPPAAALVEGSTGSLKALAVSPPDDEKLEAFHQARACCVARARARFSHR